MSLTTFWGTPKSLASSAEASTTNAAAKLSRRLPLTEKTLEYIPGFTDTCDSDLIERISVRLLCISFSCVVNLLQIKSSPQKPKTWTLGELTQAILLTKGPVCTIKAIQKNGPPHLRKASFAQFVSAAKGLQSLGLGSLEHVNNSLVYIKKIPLEAKLILQENQHLSCRFEDYFQRFYQTPPKAIKQATWNTIMKLKLVDLSCMVDPYHLLGAPMMSDGTGQSQIEPTVVKEEFCTREGNEDTND